MDNQCGKIIRLLREHRELTQIELAKQDERYHLSKKLYRVLYYGPKDGGTLNDTLLYPLGEYEYQQTRIKEEIVNPRGTAFQLY